MDERIERKALGILGFARLATIAAIAAWSVLAAGLLAATAAQATTTDITSQFAITRSGLVLNRATSTYDSTVTLTNTSGTAVPAPISVVVSGLPGSVTLANKAGDTSDGKPYVSPMAPGSTLAPAGVLSFVLKFSNPTGVTFTSTLQVVRTVPDPPVLVRAVSTGGTSAFLIGRADGAANQSITVQASSSASCVAGVLVGGTAAGIPVTTTTDGAGYFGVGVTGVDPGNFVAAQLTSPTTTGVSTCLASSGDNDSWPKALQIVDTSPTARDFIDAPGRARWYKFDILPGQTIRVTLSGLPADYDLAVFKDIGSIFLEILGLTTTSDLTRLSAEYAPSTFSSSSFSPSTFSPSTFSPDAYAPSTFSPSTFSSSVYSPSTFSPSTFSPSTFSPSTFSPSTFSPSTFSPSTFSPSTFSPSTFSSTAFGTEDFAKAFSSAQTRSIIGVSATPGTGNEFVVVNTWNNTGTFYVRVAGHASAFSTGGQFTLSLAKDTSTCAAVTDTTLTARSAATSGNFTTVILTDSSKVDQTVAPGVTLRSRLDALAASVGGKVVDVAGDTRVEALKEQARLNPSCPFAKNLLAEEIKGIVDSYRANNPLRYVVIAGNDDAIPFFRYPDQSLLGQESGFVPPVVSTSASEASLRRDFVLSQDAYGSGTRVSLRSSGFPVPGLAVGRLIETPSEIAGMIDAYLANGVVTPRSSLVTGYDFLADAADAVTSELAAGTASAVDTLITANGISPQDPRAWPPGPWTAANLGTKLLGSRHDVIFLAGHFSANSALAADFATSLITTDLAASTTDFTNSIVFSAGCHSGYNLVDSDAIAGVTLPLDWAQAFARKKATLIAGTGYQYGDTDFIEYSERLYVNFARQLRTGTGTVSVGEALVKAKRDYLAATPDIRGIHEKALLEATLFGLPMIGVNMPGTRLPASSPGGAITPVAVTSGSAAPLGLKTIDLNLAPTLTGHALPLKNVQGGADVNAFWLSGPDGVVSNPVEPALPLAIVNATPTENVVLRGVGFRGGSYTDSTVVPLTGAPTTELRGVHVPFVSPVFFPMRTWTVNYFGALGGNGATSLLVTPAQHRALDIAQGTSTLRKFNNLNLRLYYSGNLTQAALSDAPSIIAVDAQTGTDGVTFAAQVVGDPAAAIHEVWITYTSDGANAWTPLDLSQCVRATPTAPLPAVCGTTEDSRLWKGKLPGAVPAGFKYVWQAANGVGLVSLLDNFGAYYSLAGTGQTATTLALVDPVPTAGTFGGNVNVTAELRSAAAAPVVGVPVTIAVGGAANVGTTDSTGRVTTNLQMVALPGSYQIVASFGGDANYVASATSASFAVGQATSSLSVDSGTQTTLTAAVGGKTQPLMQEAVKFTLSKTGLTKEVFGTTDYLGRATMPSPGLPAGNYSVTASFAGNATYSSATALLGSLSIAADTIDFGVGSSGGAGLPASITLPGSATFTVASGSGQAVTVATSPNPSLVCTLSSVVSTAGTTYTVTGVTPGTCTLVATAGGTTTYATVSVTRSVAIKSAQSILFAALPDKTYGDPAFAVSATGTASGNPVTFSTTSTACSATGTNGATVTLLAAGSCAIAANQAESEFYSAAPTITRTFTIKRASQAISPIPMGITPPSPTFAAGGTGTFSVSATAPGGTVTFAYGPAAICTVSASSNATAVMKSGGICNVVANQAGNTNYDPAPEVTQPVTIRKASQTINFAGPGNQTFGTPPITLSATATSGLAVAFGATGNCTVAGTVLTLTAAGSCTITASQAGNDNFDPAPDVVRAITIGSADLPNTWTLLTAKMTTERMFHTATRFESGTLAGLVLIAGGIERGGARLQTSELYNPTTRTFVATSNKMLGKSSDHTATLLQSGKVIVLGGGNSSVQLFDPDTRKWTSAGSPSSSLTPNRSNHTATRLPDGKVLFVGGADSSGNTLKSTIVYNPAGSGSFAAGPVLDVGRERHTATLLPNGKVLIVGGRAKSGSNYTTHATWQICDAAACTASAGDIGKRHSHAAVALGPDGGKVLVAGGSNGTSDIATVALFTFNATTGSGTWATTGLGTLAGARSELTLSELPNGRALAVGGINGNDVVKTADAYQPPFASVAPMKIARGGHTATPLKNAAGNITGILVVGGGEDNADDDDPLDSAEIYGTP